MTAASSWPSVRRSLKNSCDGGATSIGSRKSPRGAPNMPQSQGTKFPPEPLTFIVKHQLWDGNVEDHSDQGISIEVAADVCGKETALLRFNCFDIEKSYIYGPENPELTTPDRVGGGIGVHCRMDPIVDGNPIGWTIRTLGQKL